VRDCVLVVGVGTLLLWSAFAFAQPAVIPRMAQTPHDAAQTFATLKRYFSDPYHRSVHAAERR